MPLIDDMAGALIILIRTGVVFRFMMIQLAIMGDDEKEGPYKKRRRNTLIFYILSESIYQIQDLVSGYL